MIFEKKLLVLILITVFVISGMILEPSGSKPDISRYIIANIGQFLIILISVFIGFNRVRSFGFKSAIGKSLAFISFGLLSWGMGVLIWTYYNIMLFTEVPYPSVADIGFLGAIPLATYGLISLLKNIKFKLDYKTICKLIIFPFVTTLIIYWMFIYTKLAENIPTLTKILNITYPTGDMIILSFTFVILSLIKGGKLFKPISIICIGFIIQSIADFSFSWTVSVGTYFTGSWVDILFALAFFTTGVGMYYTEEIKK